MIVGDARTSTRCSATRTVRSTSSVRRRRTRVMSEASSSPARTAKAAGRRGGRPQLLDRQSEPRPRARCRIRVRYGRHLRGVLGGAAPGGLLVTVTKNTRPQGPHPRPSRRSPSRSASKSALATSATSSRSTLRCATQASSVDPRSGRRPRCERPRSRGEPASVVVHEDVCCFAKGTRPDSAQVAKAVRNGE